MFTFEPHIYYETPGGQSAPGTAQAGGAPGNGAQPAPPQPGAPGQGQGQDQGFRQTFFPNVPDEQWGLIEPHVTNINRHVTQLQQRYAPFNGYTPEAVQGLANFAQAFDADPVGQWVGMARMLQQRGVLDPDLDIDHLESLLNDEEPGGPEGGAQMPQVEGLPPEVQELIGGLHQTVQQLQQRLDSQDQRTTQRTQDAALQRNLTWMREQLKGTGIDEKLLTEERLLASFIAHRGNAQSAVKDLSDFRSGMLQGYVEQGQQRQRQPLQTKNGIPQSGKRPTGGRRGMFGGDVSAAAEQYLRTQGNE